MPRASATSSLQGIEAENLLDYSVPDGIIPLSFLSGQILPNRRQSWAKWARGSSTKAHGCEDTEAVVVLGRWDSRVALGMHFMILGIGLG